MLNKRPTQFKLQIVNMEELVPSDHLLRKIDRYIDFSFISELTRDLYSADKGRPAIDPVVLFKMLFIGYLFGIRSERRLVQEITVNIAYRWFIGYDLDESIPDHSVFSQNRRRRFDKRPELEQEIFDEIVRQAMEYGLISGQYLYTDSTHIKANANKRKFEGVVVSSTPKAYLEELNRSVDEKRQDIGKKRFQDKDDDDKGNAGREIKRSRVDPDAGYLTREGKPKGFFYLDHRTVDGRYGMIVDSYVTAGNVHDTSPYVGRLRSILDRFGFGVKAVGLDAGYKSSYISKVLSELGIYGVVGYRRVKRQKGLIDSRRFQYDGIKDRYVCPEGQYLALRTVDRRGYGIYQSSKASCVDCMKRNQCTKGSYRQISRHIWQGYVEEMESHRLTAKGKRIYKRRQETVERSFADAKELHGLRYARFRGLLRVKMQCLLTAISQNMKKIALVMSKRELAISAT